MKLGVKQTPANETSCLRFETQIHKPLVELRVQAASDNDGSLEGVLYNAGFEKGMRKGLAFISADLQLMPHFATFSFTLLCHLKVCGLTMTGLCR